MKSTILKFVAASAMILLSFGVFAQVPPHPDGGGGPGGGNEPVGGAAPLDGGLSILLILGAAYGMKNKLKIKN